MNNKEKQIEEMAKDIYATGVAIDGTDIAYGVYDNDDHFHRMARKLYKAGYRKQSDTAKEFLKLLKEKESPKLLMWEYGEGYLDCIKTAEELAAEYGVEVEE